MAHVVQAAERLGINRRRLDRVGREARCQDGPAAAAGFVAHVSTLRPSAKAAVVRLGTSVRPEAAAERLGINGRGLDRVDRQAVKLLLRRGRATGIKAIAAKLGLDLETYQDVHEPWLEQSGFVERTPEGRIATEKARNLYRVRAEN